MANIDKIKVDGTTYDIRDSSAQHDNPGNGTLTITQNGTSKGTFTANQSTASTIDIDVHNGVATANNLQPTDDTPSAWKTLLADNSGTQYFVTRYDAANVFTNQPSRYGILETIIHADSDSHANIYQRWVATSSTSTYNSIYYRTGNVNGWKGSATASGAFTQIVPTDENVKITSTNPTSTTTYYPTWVDSSGTKGENINNGFAYISRNGTTSQDGVAVVQAGNAIASGTANNKKGYFRVYNKNSNYASIGYNDSSTSDTVHTLPATGGTIVNNNTFRSQATVTTTENGLMIAADKVKLDNLDNTKDVDKNVNSATKLTKTETVLSTDKVPYVYRKALSPSGFSGYIREMLVGVSVSWNQMIAKNGATTGGNFGVTFKNNGDGSWTLTGKPTQENCFYNLMTAASSNVLNPNHVYFMGCDCNNSKVGLALASQNATGFSMKCAYGSATLVKTDNYTVASNTHTWVRFQINSNNVDIGTVNMYPFVTDLTIMLGSVIADYIYSLESSTAGAGVSLLRSLGLFTKPYYAQDNGSIQSVCVKEKKIVGFNQWNEEWELGNYNASGQPIAATDRIRTKNYIPVLSNTDYYFYCSTASVGGLFYFYDANKEYISSVEKGRNTIFTTPQNACYLRFRMYSQYGIVYKNDICINISDASKNGTYEPYHLDTIPLSATDLRGIPKLDSNNNLYFDGDEYTSDGKIKRKYKSVDAGTLTWYYNNGTSVYFYTTNLPDKAQNSNIICAIYNVDTSPTTSMADKTIKGATTDSRFYVKDSAYTDATTFKSAMSGVYLVYELATPTISGGTVMAYQNPQYAKDGTEEFVDGKTRDIAVPVGHVTEYMGATAGEYQAMPTMPVDSGKYNLVTDGHCVEWEKQNAWEYAGNTILSTPYVYNSNLAIKEVKIRLTCVLGDYQQAVGFVEFDDESNGYVYCSIGNKDDVYAKFLISKTIIQPISIIVSNNDVIDMAGWTIYIYKR